jgi:nicotinate-nucleotide adenylyltransferase
VSRAPFFIFLPLLHSTQLAPSIGLLGGSFNPPHNAHLALAQAARQQLALTRVDLMPAGQPWQKSHSTLAPATARMDMCRLAVADVESLGVEPCEILRPGDTFTVDTLVYLKAQNPNHSYTLIIGADQANRFDTWRDWTSILGLCRLAIVSRNGVAGELPAAVRSLCSDVHTLYLPASNISSSAIRAQIAAGKSIKHQVPEAVERYIVKHSLYKTL